MDIPIICPICQEVMLTEFNGAYILIKSCLKNISHGIKFIAVDKTENVLDVELRLAAKPEVWALWDLVDEKLVIRLNNSLKLSTPGLNNPHPYSRDMGLPYFYPDISDCHKLISKLKTYLVFS